MLFLNLSLAQFLTLFGAITAFSVALYLLDRTRRRQVVATLRFWVEPGQPAPVTRRRKIQQPFSLLLRILVSRFTRNSRCNWKAIRRRRKSAMK